MKGSQPGANLRKPRWDMERMPKFEKNFYQEHPTTAARTDVCTNYGLVISQDNMHFAFPILWVSSDGYVNFGASSAPF